MLLNIWRILETGFEFPGYGLQGYQTYESNIDFEIRFMADMQIVGCNWIEIPSGVYKVREAADCISRCQLEIDVQCKDIISHPAEGDYIKIAPLRILSLFNWITKSISGNTNCFVCQGFDIECAGRRGIFPEPEKGNLLAKSQNLNNQINPLDKPTRFGYSNCQHGDQTRRQGSFHKKHIHFEYMFANCWLTGDFLHERGRNVDGMGQLC